MRDTLTAPAGIAVSTRFNPVPFSGTTIVEGNTIVRSGGWEPNWNTSFGAIWVFADTSHITTPVIIRDTEILDSTYEGILVSGSHWVNDLRVSDVVIEGTGSYGVAARVGGDHRFANVRASGVATQGDGQHQFWGTVIDEGGNFGLLEAPPSLCSVEVEARRDRLAGTSFRATLTNTGDAPIDGWNLAWHLGDGEWIADASGATVHQDGSHVAASPVDRNAVIEPGDAVNVDFTVATNGAPVAPPAWFTLDGVPCTID